MTARELAWDIAAKMETLEAGRASSFLMGGLIAQVLGRIGDDRWREMMAKEALPCGEVDCSCEDLRVTVMDALDELRTDFLEQSATIPGEEEA